MVKIRVNNVELEGANNFHGGLYLSFEESEVEHDG